MIAMFDILFIEIAVVIITAGLVALVAQTLRQPLIIAYIITGLILGPSLLGLAGEPEIFEALSEIGIAFLLFLVGLNLNWRSVKDVGRIALMAGVGQVLFTSLIGYFVISQFGFDVVTSVLLAISFAFSSTIIIVKLLSDKEDLDRFYGRISIGMLIVQDVVAMVLLLGVGALRGGGSIEAIVSVSLVKGLLVLIMLWVLAKYLLPHVFRYAAHSQELLFLVALSWCFAIASVLHLLGFGIEIGALLAGIALAGSNFAREIESKIRPLRDFFLIIFFIVLGTNLDISHIGSVIIPGLVLSAFILIGNPFIVMLILRLFGYHPRTGFLVGVTMAQVSEFSFILLAGGIAAGIIESDVLPLATIVALITIAISSYLIKYNESLYERIEFLFRWLDVGHEKGRKRLPKAPEVLILGFHRIGESILPTLKKMDQEYLIVDFDPVVISALERDGIPHQYGDAGNEDFLSHVRAEKSKIIISTIPDKSISKDVIRFLKKKRSRATVIVTVKTAKEAAEMYDLGANFVIIPNILGGEYFAELLSKKKSRKASWSIAAKKHKHILAVDR
jgi:Kef-type K+ transport system membrane component KefB